MLSRVPHTDDVRVIAAPEVDGLELEVRVRLAANAEGVRHNTERQKARHGANFRKCNFIAAFFSNTEWL
jgi:hypothetical protein